jgi:Uncharacterized protein conserved in bacteria
MEDKIKELLVDKVGEYGVVIDSIEYEKGSNNFLHIVLDREEIISLDLVVEVTKAINPILDNDDLIKEEYILDVYAKSKGDVK